MALTPQEKAQLREIEAQLEADDVKLARLLRTEPVGGPILVKLQQLRTRQLVIVVVIGLLAGPVGLELGQGWLGLAGFAAATVCGVPLLARWVERRQARRDAATQPKTGR
jgi:hypothetical protein